MPDTPPESGVPSAEQQARVELREKYANALRHLWREPDDCPICRNNQWNIGDLVQAQIRDVAPTSAQDVFIADIASTTTRFRMPQVYLYVPVTCLVCGYTLFFHSGVLDDRAATIAEATIKATSSLEARPRTDEDAQG